jgi:hypothetical protein
LTDPKERPILTYRKDERKVSFSRQIVSIIAANVLVVHVVVGCCAHHAHLRAGSEGLAVVNQHGRHVHHSSHRCHHYPADSKAPSNGEKPCDHSCGEGSCSFLAGSRIILPELAAPAGILAASPSVLLNQMAPRLFTADSAPDGILLPPVRSHLAKCVLLV